MKISVLLIFSLVSLSFTQDNANKEQVSDATTTSKTKTIDVQSPEMIVIQPIRRKGVSHALVNQAPCGGIEKSNANTLTQVGKKINAIWEIKTPVANGNCTVSISAAHEHDFVSLKPITGAVAYNDDFSFSCGRSIGFDFQEFELPKNYACDHCTLQIKWDTPVGTYYTCSDMMILGNKVENCMAKCLNGGACVNGSCVCKKNFQGEFCEIDQNGGSNLGWIILIILIFSAVIVGGFLLFRKTQESWMKPENDSYKKEFIEDKKKETNID